MLLALLASQLTTASAQDYRFPTSDADYKHFYPTAYLDHGGNTDWDCGTITYSGHGGADFGVGGFDGMYAGRDIVAAADGQVITALDGYYDECTTADCEGGGGYGNYVQLEHGDGRRTIYGHMRTWSVAVAEGDRVSCGDKIGEVGSSGYSTGPHLHFEVREASGSRSDPFDGPCSAPPSYWRSQGTYGYLPAPTCADAGPCATEGELTCGDSISGRSDSGGATNEHYFYGCEEWMYSGPERSWVVITDRDESVTVRLSGLTDDLDLYALGSDACDGGDCLASSSGTESQESITFDAAAGGETVIVIDGWEGAVSDFVLEVDCQGGFPQDDSAPPDTDPPPDTEPPDTGLDTDAPGNVPGPGPGPGDDGTPKPDIVASWDRTDLDEFKGGCACLTGPAGPAGPGQPVGALLLLALAWRRRA